MQFCFRENKSCYFKIQIHFSID